MNTWRSGAIDGSPVFSSPLVVIDTYLRCTFSKIGYDALQVSVAVYAICRISKFLYYYFVKVVDFQRFFAYNETCEAMLYTKNKRLRKVHILQKTEFLLSLKSNGTVCGSS